MKTILFSYFFILAIYYEALSVSGTSSSIHISNYKGLNELGVEKINDTAPGQLFAFNKNVREKQRIPDDYLIINRVGAYKLYHARLNWNEARKVCIQEGAHLAVIRSDAENNLVAALNGQYRIDFAWLGFHDQFETNDWTTIHDESLYIAGARWAPGEPNNAQNTGEHCGTYMKSLGLNDLPCHHRIPFYCKIDLF